MKRATKRSGLPVLFFRIFLVCCLIAAVFAIGNGQSRKELEKLRSKKEKEIAVTKKKLEETRNKKEQSEEELNTLREQISQKRELTGIYNSELSRIEEEIGHLNEDIESLENEINSLKTEFARLVVNGYKARYASSRINFLFSANTFPETIRRFIYLKKLLAFRKQQISLIQAKKSEKANSLAEREHIKAEKLGIVESTEQIRKELEVDESSVEVLLNKLQIKESGLAADLKKKEKAYRELDAALKRAIEKEIEAARKKAEKKKEKDRQKSKTKNTSKGKAEEKSEEIAVSGFGKMKNRLLWPVSGGSVTQSFGSHRHPTLPDVTVINNGVNISGSAGSTVKCVYEGEISTILQIPGMKNTVLIKHGDFFTVYSKLETVDVKRGDKVVAGQSLGTLGPDTDGKTELHFEVWQGNQRMDPEGWLK